MLAGALLLVGSPMPDRSKAGGQTENDPMAIQVGVGHWTNNPVLEKEVYYRNSNRRNQNN